MATAKLFNIVRQFDFYHSTALYLKLVLEEYALWFIVQHSPQPLEPFSSARDRGSFVPCTMQHSNGRIHTYHPQVESPTPTQGHLQLYFLCSLRTTVYQQLRCFLNHFQLRFEEIDVNKWDQGSTLNHQL